MTYVIDTHVTRMSPGVKSGRILIPKFQWEGYPLEIQDLYEPILVATGVVMYRYKAAKEPYTGKEFKADDLDPNDMHEHFMILVNDFVVALNEGQKINIVVGDEDEEFVYGAFCTALATCKRSEADWILEHMYGNLYTIKHIDLELEDGED